MENKVVMQFRDVLMEHRSRTEAVMDKIDAARADFEAKRNTPMQYTDSQQYAIIDELVKPLRDELPGRVQRVNDLMDKVRDALPVKYALRGEAVHPDAQLLTGAFDLSVDQLKVLHDRHQDNPTMSAALKSYIQKNNVPGVAFSFRTLEAEEQAYNALAGQARSWMNRMTNDITKATARTILSFTDDYGMLAPNIQDVLGDGAGLLD